MVCFFFWWVRGGIWRQVLCFYYFFQPDGVELSLEAFVEKMLFFLSQLSLTFLQGQIRDNNFGFVIFVDFFLATWLRCL